MGVYEHICMHVYVRMWDVCGGREKNKERNNTFHVKFLWREKKELLKFNKRTGKKEPLEKWEEKQKYVPEAMGEERFIGEMRLAFSSKSRYWNN